MLVSDQIIQVLDALCEKFGLVIDWTSENIIPYASTLFSKLVSYEIWTSVAWMIFVAILLVLSIIGIKKFIDDTWGELIVVPCAILGFICIACVMVQVMDIIKCLTFPEMFVFEYVQNLINSAH